MISPVGFSLPAMRYGIDSSRFSSVADVFQMRLKSGVAEDAPHPARTTCVFDWDDTLFPTGLFKDLKKKEDPSLKDRMALLDEKVALLLEKASLYGHVCVITNASFSWYQQCLAWFPRTQEKVQTLEAKGSYEFFSAADMYSASMKDHTQWKKNAFEAVLNQRHASVVGDSGLKHNIVSIGDGPYEAQAMRDYAEVHAGSVWAKHHVFTSYLHWTRMHAGIEMLIQNMPAMFASTKSL
jgi:hypothetical protein